MGEITEDDVRTYAAKGKVKKLIQAAGSGDRWVRAAAVKALVEMRDPKTVPLILSAIKNDYMGSETTVALAAAEFADESGLRLFGDLLGGSSLSLRVAAKTALARTSGGYPVLVAALRSDNAACRKSAAEALGGQGSPESVEPLCAAIDDPDEQVRAACAQALASIGDERAVPALETALARDYRDDGAKADIAAALAALRHDETAPAGPSAAKAAGAPVRETVKVVVRISGAVHGSTLFAKDYNANLPLDLDGPNLLNSLAMTIMRPGQNRYYNGYQLACPGGTLRSSADGDTTKPVTLRDAGVKDGDVLEFIDWGGSFV